jgi:hypothetical protein
LRSVKARWFSPRGLEVAADSLPAVVRRRGQECHAMLDVFMLVIGIGFFALAVDALACERL